MLSCAVGQAEGLSGAALIESVLEQCASQLQGATPQAGILFASGQYQMPPILQRILAAHPGLHLVGCSSGGDVTSRLGFSEDSLSLLLLCSDELGFSSGVIRADTADPLIELSRACRSDTRPPRLCLLFPGGHNVENDALLDLVMPHLPQGCALFGGRAAVSTGARYDFLLQFRGTELTRDGAPFLLIHDSGRLRYSFAVSNAWLPVGAPQRVAQSSGSRVMKIGDRSALGYYRHYLGPHSRPAAEFPLAVFEEDEEHYFLRVAQGFDPASGTVVHAARVKEGALVQLTEAVRSTMLQNIAESATRAAQELAMRPALALVISCAARKMTLGTRIEEEHQLIAGCLPSDVPLFGFYSWGEIAPCAPGWPSRTHNATLVTLLLSCGDPEPPPVRPMDDLGPAALSSEIDVVSYAADVVEELSRTATSNDPALINKRLQRSEYYRMLLEDTRELHSSMLRTINAEIEGARQKIAEQNRALQALYAELQAEKHKSEELLLSILPRDIADELKRTSRVEPIYYPMASVMFTDFVGFTRIAGSMSPAALIAELDYFFSGFDRIVEAHGLEKLKTIGDAYMCAAGVPTPRATHAEDAVTAAWEIQRFMQEAIAERRRRGAPYWELRIGVNSGPLMAGVIGRKKFAYDIWGHTVNVAARLESTSEPGRINIAQDTYEKVRHRFDCEPRGKILAKNAGEIDMYFVRGPRSG